VGRLDVAVARQSVGVVAVLEQGGREIVALQQPIDFGAVASCQPRHFADLAAGQFQQGDEVITLKGRARLGQRLDVGGLVAQGAADQCAGMVAVVHRAQHCSSALCS